MRRARVRALLRLLRRRRHRRPQRCEVTAAATAAATIPVAPSAAPSAAPRVLARPEAPTAGTGGRVLALLRSLADPATALLDALLDALAGAGYGGAPTERQQPHQHLCTQAQAVASQPQPHRQESTTAANSPRGGVLLMGREAPAAMRTLLAVGAWYVLSWRPSQTWGGRPPGRPPPTCILTSKPPLDPPPFQPAID